ncbi:MAG: aromatic acid decarboxylase [Chlamydiales bacterium]|jgi:4-hydroxy-3-polyprenylbenzoate decarboxylase|nr:aromatic acid decarboxylase [Chlamydiales bacterium]
MQEQRIIVGISGGSGAVLAHRMVGILIEKGYHVDLVISQAGFCTIAQELGPSYNSLQKFMLSFEAHLQSYITPHRINDMGATIASGSYHTLGMVVVPCSMASLAAISMGLSDNLLRRAADVTLKEKRKLIIVPRESPLSEIHLENMLRLAKFGATIVPPMPAWYSQPKSLEEVEIAIVGRILDSLNIYLDIYPRWQGLIKYNQ